MWRGRAFEIWGLLTSTVSFETTRQNENPANLQYRLSGQLGRRCRAFAGVETVFEYAFACTAAETAALIDLLTFVEILKFFRQLSHVLLELDTFFLLVVVPRERLEVNFGHLLVLAVELVELEHRV